jgi:hypothetical protein
MLPSAIRSQPGWFATTWRRRVWLVGFAFFFIKGLLWLTVPLMLYWLG